MKRDRNREWVQQAPQGFTGAFGRDLHGVPAAAPLTGVAGAVPVAFLIGNGTGVPLTFALMAIIMLAFAVG